MSHEEQHPGGGSQRPADPDPRGSPGRWDPVQYERFSTPRLRPAIDLLSRIPHPGPRSIVDLGCGTGQVTRMLGERWPHAAVTGLDSSAAMLAKAVAGADEIEWVQGDIATWDPAAAVELIFSNAALHWLPDHDRLFPRLLRSLGPGGCLAVQMPRSFNLPSHALMRATLEYGGPGGSPFGSLELRERVARRPVEEGGFYVDCLQAAGARSVDVWETEYWHELGGADPVCEWVRGTGLLPILEGLEAAERECYLAEYGRRVRGAYPQRADGSTLYPFRRMFVVATI